MLQFIFTLLITLLGITLFAQNQDKPAILNNNTQAQTWTHVVPTGNGNQKAFLWVPPSASTGIRGLILSAHTVAEDPFSLDPAIRAVASEEHLAIIYFNPALFSGFGHPDTDPKIAGDTLALKSALRKLAQVSGFSEIEYAPWITFGHSTSSAFARNVVWWKPEKSFGAIIFKGGAIYKPRWTSKSIQNVPVLAVNGQREEYGPNGGCNPPFFEAQHWAVRDSLMKLRVSESQGHLVNLIVAPGEGHFSWTPKVAAFIAKFIEQAARAKIPRNLIAKTHSVSLIHIDDKQGWLSDTTLMGPLSNASIGAYATFKGDKQYAFWHFNREMAQRWLDFHKDKFGKPLQDDIKFENGTYEQCGMFYKLKDITLTGAGEFTVNASAEINPGKIKYRIISGPAIQLVGNRFNVDWFKLEYMDRVWLIAYKDEDDKYSYGERLALVKINRKNTGTAQEISMPEIPDQTIGNGLRIAPVANSGLPVIVKVFSGPAAYNETTKILKIQSFSYGNFPFDTATVVLHAFQPGNAVYAASPLVERIFKVTGSGTSIITGSFERKALFVGCPYKITFNTTGAFSSNNTFIAQLSDANGNFRRPVTLGIYSGIKARTIQVKIPKGTPKGNGYRLRVLSSRPASRVLESKNEFSVFVRDSEKPKNEVIKRNKEKAKSQ